MIEVSWAEVKDPLDTQLGSWLCQTQLWPSSCAQIKIPHSKFHLVVSLTSEYLTILLRKSHNLVGTSPRELSLSRFSRIPLHAITGSNLAERRAVAEDGDICRVGKFWIIGGRPEVKLAFRFG